MKKIFTLSGLILSLSLSSVAFGFPTHPSGVTFTFFNGAIMKGLNEAIRNGLIVGYHDDGDTAYVGSINKSQLNGTWRSWYPTRLLCDSGRLVKNIPDGEWKGWYPNGQVKFVYHFNARKLSALKDELRRQPKTKFFHIASKPPEVAAEYYNAERIFGHRNSKPQSIFLSRQIHHKARHVSQLKDAVDYNTAERDEHSYLPPFTEALLHGNFTEYYETGRVKKTGVYINGLREGMWEEFTESGTKAVGTYRHGYPNGEWRYYDAKGKLLKWKRFDNKGHVSEEFEFNKSANYRRS